LAMDTPHNHANHLGRAADDASDAGTDVATHATLVDQIRAENRRREREISADFYALFKAANLFLYQGQMRGMQWALRTAGLVPLAERRILEVGCGRGNWLAMFEAFGARRENFAGTDLDEYRIADCAQRFPTADIRVGEASRLAWPGAEFDFVFQGTMFSSILDWGMQRAVASEMLRVLKPDGAILWYDFHMNNPRNPHVRGVPRDEIQSLFPGCRIALRRTTLAPPIARRIVLFSWLAGEQLESMRVLNTHYFGVLRRSE
jgi:ubiquinone/menaquinone biosynthesis C-methylase UbiE